MSKWKLSWPEVIALAFGSSIGTAITIACAFIDAPSVHMDLYSAIAAAIPVLLLAVTVRIGQTGNYYDDRLDQRIKLRDELAEELEELRSKKEDAETERLSKRVEAALARNPLSWRPQMLPYLAIVLIVCCFVAVLGEVSCLVALGGHDSTYWTFWGGTLGVGEMFGVLLLMEMMVLYLRSSDRQ